jgi:hypothetical protein
MSLSAVLASCAGDPIRQPLSRDPGPPPAYLAEVQVPNPQAGENSYVVATRERRGRETANVIIRCAIEERTATRESMIAGKAVKQNDACVAEQQPRGGKKSKGLPP